MKLTLTIFEITALFTESLKKEASVEFYYDTNDKDMMGIRYFADVEGIYCRDNEIELIFNMTDDYYNSLTILVPKERRTNISCQIVYEHKNETDSDMLIKANEKISASNLKEDEREPQKCNKEIFKLSFDNFTFDIHIEREIFYEIISNLEKYTEDYISYLTKMELQDRQVDIDGFWESIDNALEK